MEDEVRFPLPEMPANFRVNVSFDCAFCGAQC